MTTTALTSLAGEPGPLNAEVTRLGMLRDRLWAAADDVEHLAVNWSGPSSDRFVESQRMLVNRWRAAGDLHDDALRALERYRDERVELARRADDIDLAAGADPILRLVAAEDIQRLCLQLDVLASQAAAEINRCAEALRSFGLSGAMPAPSLNLAAPTVPQAAEPIPPSSSEPAASVSSPFLEQPGVKNLDQALNGGQVTEINLNVRVLGAEILLGEHEVLPGDDG